MKECKVKSKFNNGDALFGVAFFDANLELAGVTWHTHVYENGERQSVSDWPTQFYPKQELGVPSSIEEVVRWAISRP